MSKEPLSFKVEAQQPQPLRLVRAILLYANANRTLASVHECASVQGKPVILAGRALTARMSQRLAASLAKQGVVAEYLPSNVLLSSGALLIWYEPARVRHLGFTVSTQFPQRSLGTRSADVPTPSTLFVAGERHWRAYALKGAQRPTPGTPLYIAPYYNVDRDGRICAGNVRVPSSALAQRLAAWNTAFFGSLFSHANDDALVFYPGDATGLWRDLLDGKYKRFPQRVLRPAGFTLGDLIQEVTR